MAVWVGIIALAGVDAETGVVMLLYLDHAYDRERREGRMNNLEDLERAVLEGAVQRVRPKMMTVMAMMAATAWKAAARRKAEPGTLGWPGATNQA